MYISLSTMSLTGFVDTKHLLGRFRYAGSLQASETSLRSSKYLLRNFFFIRLGRAKMGSTCWPSKKTLPLFLQILKKVCSLNN